MNPERWRRLKDITADALELPATARPAFVARACGDDPELRREVESILAQSGARMDHFADYLQAAIAREPEADESRTGDRLGAYRILREIGRGGMGAVYLGERADAQFEKRVAIKILKRGTDTDEVLRRFRIERQILARLEHPHIARLLDAGTTADGLPYLVMEYVDGERITDFCAREKLSTRARIELFLKVCAAVEFAHRNLIVHRDLKPGNVLVTAEGEPKLLDFGIAKLLAAEDEALGATLTLGQSPRLTPGYASPEQVRDEPVTTASDVYSLGALLFDLLAGEPPHRFATTIPSPTELLRVVAEQECPRASSLAAAPERRRELRGDLDRILQTALRKEPQHRYSGVAALADDLNSALARRPIKARPATMRYRAGKFIARNKIGVAAAALVCLSLLAGIVGTGWQAHLAQRRFNDVRSLAHSVLFDYYDAIASLPGSTTLRERVVKDALAFVDRLARDAGNDRPLQLELAQAYLKIGDVQGKPYTANLGEAAAAQRSYEKAAAIARPLANAEKGTAATAARRVESAALSSLATVQVRTNQLERATQNHQRVLALGAELLRDDPAHAADWRRLLIASHMGLGDAVQAGNHTRSDPALHRLALAHYQRALPLAEQVVTPRATSESDLMRLAKSRARVATILGELAPLEPGGGKYAAAIALHERNRALYRQLMDEHPHNPQYNRNLADGFVMMANARLRSRRDLEIAASECQAALKLETELAAADPQNAEAQQDLAFACSIAGRVAQARGESAAAVAHYHRSRQILEPLVRQNPANVETAFDLAQTRRGLAELGQP
ncbi:MAG TPA: protein kinase [Chthoniobacterales bacterium]|nr:protein kinase [Chthoniobacterales bacterium]